MNDLKNHTRVNDILLGPLERAAIKYCVSHMPAWVTPDTLTGIGLLGTVLIFVGYWFSRFDHNYLWLATFGFFMNWFGDSLDGGLARFRNIQRPRYGFFIDHTVDIFCELAIFLGLGLSGYVRFEIASMVLVSYLMVSIMVYIQMLVTGIFQISYGKLGPTEARAIAVLANIAIYFFGNPTITTPAGVFSLFDLIGLAAIVVIMAIFFINSFKQGRILSAQDNAARVKANLIKENKGKKKTFRRRSKAHPDRSPLNSLPG